MGARHVWDDGNPRDDGANDVLGEWLMGALSRYDAQVDHHSHLLGAGHAAVGKQGELVAKIETLRARRLEEGVNNEWDASGGR